MFNNNYEELVLLKSFAFAIGIYLCASCFVDILGGDGVNYMKSGAGILMLFIGKSIQI